MPITPDMIDHSQDQPSDDDEKPVAEESEEEVVTEDAEEETPETEDEPAEGDEPDEEKPEGEEGDKDDEDEEPAAAVQKYKMPDGRELTAEEIQQEYLKLQGDYTKKAQRLSELEKDPTIKKTDSEQPKKFPWQEAGWKPKDANELLEAAAQKLKFDQDQVSVQAAARLEEVNARIATEIAAIRVKDPKFSAADEEALFKHATKYKFNDLLAAYENMNDFKSTVRTVQDETKRNIGKRQSDRVAIPNKTGDSDGAIDFDTVRRNNQAGGGYAAVQAALERFRK